MPALPSILELKEKLLKRLMNNLNLNVSLGEENDCAKKVHTKPKLK